MPDALELLKTRRSIKPIELAGPAPSAAEIETLLTVASRVPDHGKLVPWRFIIFEGEARLAAGEAIVAAFCAKYPQAKPEHVEAERARLARAPLVIAVVSRAARAARRCGGGGRGSPRGPPPRGARSPPRPGGVGGGAAPRGGVPGGGPSPPRSPPRKPGAGGVPPMWAGRARRRRTAPARR